MKVLVATQETQGTNDGDYCWTVDGELVYIQGLTCANPKCGCDRGFAGMSSSRATTTAMVVDRPDLAERDVAAALTASLERGGWLAGASEEETKEIIDEYLAVVDAVTTATADGTVVRRRGDMVFAR